MSCALALAVWRLSLRCVSGGVSKDLVDTSRGFCKAGAVFFKKPKIPNANDCLNIVCSTSFSLKKSDRA